VCAAALSAGQRRDEDGAGNAAHGLRLGQAAARPATSGDLGDASYTAARGEANRLAHTALDGVLSGGLGGVVPPGQHGARRLDAVVALSGGPAWLTDHVLGDYPSLSTAGPAAVCGYPSMSVPAGLVAGLPVGLTFMGPAWSEARLLALAFAFEQAALA